MPAAITPPPFPALKDTRLFTPLTIGKLVLEHRIVQVSSTHGSPTSNQC